MKPPKLSTRAQSLWRDEVLTGRYTVKEALDGYCHGIDEADLQREINSMPEDMVAALKEFVAGQILKGDGLEIGWLELKAFDQDFDAALKWKHRRLKLISAAIQARKQSRQNACMLAEKVINGPNGRLLLLRKDLDEHAFRHLLEEMKNLGIEFSFYDEKYPSPSPSGLGAYLSYSPKNGAWRMTFGDHAGGTLSNTPTNVITISTEDNHCLSEVKSDGWMGGIYAIKDSVLLTQLRNLHSLGELDALELDNVGFFSRYRPESESRNQEINDLIQEIHSHRTQPPR